MIDVAEFVKECVEQAGGLADRRDGLVEVLVPDPLRDEFQGQEVVRLALDPESAARVPDALPALPGSQLLDRLIDYALKQGRITCAYPRMEAVRPRNIAGEILRAVTFTARRVRLPEGAASVEPATMAQFDFILSLISDEKEESLQSVVVDLWSGLPSRALTQVVGSLEADASGPTPGRRVRYRLEQAYAVARETLQEWLAPRIERHQALVTRRLQAEHGRLRLYYDSLLEDLERRAQRAAAEEERLSSLRQKMEATRIEKESKLGELSEKYRLRPCARLAAVRLLTYLRLFSTVGLDRKQTSRDLELCWDPLLGRLQLPACEDCRRESEHLELGLDARLRCPACAANTAADTARKATR